MWQLDADVARRLTQGASTHGKPPTHPADSPTNTRAHTHMYTRAARLDYHDVICDGFYDLEGDFPEVTDSAADFPSLGALRHVTCFEADPREVRRARHKGGGGRHTRAHTHTCVCVFGW